MNFAEFPIALLTDRAPKGQTSIKFEDKIYDEKRKKIIVRRRIIEGSEEYGLPTATDDVVVLGLIQLTKQKSNFTRPDVEFTRLELLELLGWPDEGRSYDRIKLSLQRIANVTYNYDNAWWDARQKKWTTKIFHILETVEINDSRAAGGDRRVVPSRIVWNEVVFGSFQDGFLRDIDFQLCIRLEHPTALRMYRFLGKRFFVKPEWTFDLKEFAYEHIGLGRNYEGGTQISRKLQAAIQELEEAGFLEPLSDEERYIKDGREWSIRFIQKLPAAIPAALAAPPSPAPEPAPAAAPAADPEPSPMVRELIGRGMTARAAVELVRQYPAELIATKIEHFDWEMAQPKPPKRPAGYLRNSIRDGYAAPPGFVSQADRRQAAESREAEARHRRAATAQARAEAERDRAERAAADRYWESLTAAEQARLTSEALAAADESIRRTIELLKRNGAGASFLTKLRRDHIRQLLQDRPSVAGDA